jgi:hypothetical protein
MQDMENSTGSWDMYGQEEKKRYPDLQAKFFTQATDILSRREALRAFIALSETASPACCRCVMIVWRTCVAQPSWQGSC